MGICITYRGSLRTREDIPRLGDDLRRRCAHLGWRCRTVDELVAAHEMTACGLQGLTLWPHPQCERMNLHLDPSGRIVNATCYTLVHDSAFGATMRAWLRENQRWIDGLMGGEGHTPVQVGGGLTISVPRLDLSDTELEEGISYNWVSTQRAGPPGHIAACLALAYVKERYAPDLEVKDDTGYFEHGNVAALVQQMAEAEQLTYRVEQAMREITQNDAEITSLNEFVETLGRSLDIKDRLH